MTEILRTGQVQSRFETMCNTSSKSNDMNCSLVGGPILWPIHPPNHPHTQPNPTTNRASEWKSRFLSSLKLWSIGKTLIDVWGDGLPALPHPPVLALSCTHQQIRLWHSSLPNLLIAMHGSATMHDAAPLTTTPPGVQ